ncbi:mucin-17-like [Lytechinus pictus]|uniref:mucin-17-like n=1 Tax=Lytechinus pictus TaxID=7653 RepID=UPI0030B9C538
MYEDTQINGETVLPDLYFFEGTTKPDDFTISGDVFWMYFGTDKNIQRTGFQISWSAIVDTTPPVFVNCPANINVNVEIGTQSTTVTWTVPTAVDASAVTTVSSHNPGQSFITGTTTTVVYTATDEFGNIGQCAFTITVTATDSIDPVVTVSSGFITRQVEIGSGGVNVFYTEPTATDNSGTAVLFSRSAQPGDFFPVGQTVVTYIFQDPSGNFGTGTFTVNVVEVDTTPPVVTVPSGIITEQVEVGTPGINVFYSEPTATDNSGTAILDSRTHQPGDFFPVGQTIVTYTFRDPSGNPATGTFTVNVVEVDTTPPVITVPTPSIITRQVEVGTPGVNVFYQEPTANDNSGTAILVSRTNQPGDFFPVGQTIVTYTFQDPSGNPASGTVTINVVEVDTTPPVISVPSTVITRTVELGTPGVNVFYPEPTASDNSGTANLVSRTNQPGDFFPVGQTVVTYTYQDPSGNPATATVTVNIVEEDTQPPQIFVTTNEVIRVAPFGSSGINVFYTEPVAVDSSGTTELVSRSAQPGDFFPIGSTVVTYVYQDASGNQATGTFTVTVQEQVDTIPPTITVPGGNIVRTVELGISRLSVDYPEPTATDNSGTAFLVSRTAQPGDLFPVGTTDVEYVFVDAAGNDARATFTVTVIAIDTTPPIVNCVNNVVQEVELGTTSAVVQFTEPTAFDISGQVNLVSQTAAPGDAFPLGTTTVTYIFSDNSNNEADPCSFTVTVTASDNTPPTVNCVNDVTQTVELGSTSTQVFFAEPTAFDISGSANLVTRTAAPGDTFPVGITTVTYIFSDAAGNQAPACTFNVIISTVDTTPPTVNCVSNIVQTVELGATSVVLNYAEPTATDVSGTAFLVSRSSAPGDSFPLGSTTVTYVFSDQSGNNALPCVFTITVGTVDTMTPMFTSCPTNIVQSVELGIPGTVISWTVPTASDAAGIATIESNIQPGSFFNVGETETILYVATDNSGLTDNSCTFTVTVFSVDTTPPTVVCTNNIFQTVELGTNSAEVVFTEPTASDISGQANLVSRTAAPGDSFPIGTTTVTYIFADNSGNVAEDCSFTITITAQDSTPPTVNCINDVIRTVELGTTSAQVFYSEPTASDVGQATLISRTVQPGDSFPVGLTTVTYIFGDNAGNIADPCVFTISVNTVDTTPPTVNCVSDVVRVVELGTTSLAVVYTEPTATDISGTASLVSRSHTPGQNFPLGSTVVSYFFSDASGNNAPACTFTVTVTTQDTIPPTVTDCPSNIFETVELGIPGTIVTFNPPQATDVSGIASVVSNIQSGSFISAGETRQVTYTVTDNSGLTDTSCTFSITVIAVDTSPPTITVPSDVITQTVELGQPGTIVNYPEPTATDLSGTAILVSRTNQPGDFFSVGQTIVTYTFQDPSGNPASGTVTINVVEVDTTPPAITVPNSVITQTVELGQLGTNVNYPEPTATDISGTANLVSRTNQPGDFFSVGQTVVTYTFQDPSGNPASGTVTINVVEVDTTPPTISVPSSTVTREVELGQTGINIFYPEPTATDISGTANLVSRTNQPGDFFPVGQTIVTYTFQDPSGNPASGTVTVIVTEVDTTPPTVNIPTRSVTREVELGQSGLNVFYPEPTATDISGVANLVSRTNQPGDFFPVGQTVVTYTFQDPSGNPAIGFITINVVEVDTTPPTISVPSSTVTREVELGQTGLNVFYPEPTATDLSGTANLVSRTNQPGDFFPVGQTVVTYTFQDPSGNPASGTVTIIVNEVDTTPPVITVPNSVITQTVELGQSGTNVNYPEPTATDISGVANLVSRTNQPGDFFLVGQTIVTYTFQDPSGNPASGTVTINVVEVDTTPPSITVPSDVITQTVELGQPGTNVNYPEPTATDLSGTANLVSRTNQPGDFFPVGQTVVTYTFQDPSGNPASGTVTINVVEVDTTPPSITVPSDVITQTVELGQPGTNVNYPEPTATDISGTANLVSRTNQPGDFFSVGQTVVTYTFQDPSGNPASGTVTINVVEVDTTPPTINVPSSTVTREVELGQSGVNVFYPEPTATDISGTANLVSRTNQPGDFFPVGQTVVTYTFQDPSGNPASGTVTVIVTEVDTTPPTISVPSSTVTREVELGQTGVNVFYPEPTASDISGVANLVSRTNQPGDFFPVGQTVVTYTFQDPSGNPASGTVTVIVTEVDTTPPTISVPSSTVTREVELGQTGVNVFYPEPTASDISGVANLVSRTNQPGDFFPVGQTVVTYTFQDPSGNPASGTVTVIVTEVDTTPPFITVPNSAITQTVELGQSGTNVNYPEPTATDISGTANLVSRTNQPGDFFPVGQTVVTYTFQDPSGNPASGTVTINVVEVDTTPPVITVPNSVITQTVELGQPGTNVNYPEPTATDISGVANLVSRTNQPGDFFPIGQSVVTYTFQDPSGNPASGTVTINVVEVDTTPPSITVPSDVITQTVELGQPGTNVNYPEPTATDISGTANLVSRTNQPGDFFPVGQTVVTYTFQDPSGNPASGTVTINVVEVDTTPPTINVPSSTVTREVELGQSGVNVFYPEPTATDISGTANLVSRTNQPGDFFPVGQTVVTYTFQDPSGNPASGTVTVIVTEVDTTPPTISVPSSTVTREVELGQTGVNVFYPEPTASDISGVANLVSRTNQPGDFFPVGQTVVTYTFQDPSGNPASGTVTVIVTEVDTTPPTISVPSSTVTREVELGQTGVNVFYPEPTASDISGVANLVSRTNQPGDFFPVGQTVVTYTFQDPSGNPASGTVTVIVTEVDTTPPFITVPNSAITQTVELGQSGTNVNYPEPTATDISGTANLVSRTNQPGDFFPVGQTVVTYTFQDPSGNPASGTVTINVVEVDTTPPVITVPNSVITQTVELGQPGTNVNYPEPTATDISGTANLVSRTNQPGDFFPVGQTVATYTFQDPSGNPASGTVTINVVEVDTTPPSITVPSDVITQTVELGQPGTNVNYPEPTATDISGTANLVSRTNQPGDFFPVGQTVVTYTFQDPSGNPASGTVTINVVEVDTTPPTINVPSSTVTREVELGQSGVNVFYPEPTATDISGTANLVSRTNQPGDFFPVGQTVVTYTFQDPSGNPASGTVTVIVTEVDTTPPTISVPSSTVTREVELGQTGVNVFYPEPTATDISGTANLVSRTNQPGDFFPVGQTVVTYTFQDPSGNPASGTVTVIVTEVDTTPPTISVPSSTVTREVELGQTGVNVFYPEPTATDISGTANLVSRTNQPGDFFPVGQTVVTYTFQDPSGNPASGTVTVIVTEVDTTPPTISVPSSTVTREVELGQTGVNVFYPEPTASDISGVANLVSRTNQPGDFFPVGQTVVTYTFQDPSENPASGTVTIIVTEVDTTPPVVTVPNTIITQTVELGQPGTNVNYPEPTATDISGTANLVSRTNQPGDFFPVGQTVVTYTFQDPSGNPATGTVTINIVEVDTTPPTITVPSDVITQTIELGQPGTNVNYPEPTASDISGTANLVSRTNQPGDFFPVGQTVVTYTFQDPSGNPASGTVTINVVEVDTIPPSVVCTSNIVQTVELGTAVAQVFYTEPTASDVSGVADLVSRTNMPGDSFPVGTTTVTYVFQDDSGNVADDCSFTITVTAQDTTPPSVVCTSSITRTVELGTTSTPVFFVEPTATDISGTANLVTRTAAPGDSFPVGVTSVTYIFADAEGNQADPCVFTITVETEDTTPPTVQCIDNIFRNVELGTTSLVVFYSEPSATDISGQPLLDSRTNAPGDSFPLGTTTISYIFTDPSGNDAAPCIFTITITATDTTPPTVTNCPESISQSVELGSTGTIITYTAPTAMDLSGIASIIPSIPPGTFFAVGETQQVTYTVTDNNGLLDSSCTFTVTVFSIDTTPPDVTCAMNIIQSVELGTQSVPITYEEPTATDISGVVILTSQSHSPGDFFPVDQTTTVTYIFTDGAGNQADPCTFTIQIVSDDSMHPTVICTNDVVRVVELGTAGVEVFYQVPSATDISGTEEIISNSNNPGDFFPVGVTTVSYLFADASGNVAPVCTFTVTVNTVDTTPPTVQNCPEDIVVTVELGTASTPVVWALPTATDVSGTAVIQSQTRQPGDEFSASTTTTINIVFVDDSNNVADPCTFTVTVTTEDTTPPTVQNCPADIIRTIEINSASEIPITWMPPTATDISGTQFISSQTANVGQNFPVGSTVVTYIFSDASGNDADPCSFNVIILTEDTTPPSILNCPSDITETTPLNSGGKVIVFVAPTAVDNSNQDPTVTVSNQPNTFFFTGETVVTYTFTDQALNPSSCSFTVTVIEVDTEKPVIQNCPSDINVNTPLGTALTVVTWPALTVTDNSGQTSVQSQTAASGDSFSPGRTVVTIVYQDPSSNTEQCQFTIIVTEVDNSDPEILSCPEDITSEVPVEASGATVTWNAPVVTDNSGIPPTVTSTRLPGTFFLRGSTQVTYTFTDNSGNQVSCSFVVSVIAVDEVAPVVVCPENIVETILEGVDSAYVTFDLPTVTDNNGATNFVSSTASSGDPFPVGTTVVTFTYVDNNNNEASCSFSVTVLTDTPCSPNPCFNAGACVVNSLTEYQCVCTECFTGTNCETQLNACDNNLCQNGAGCVAYEGSCDSYYCECPSCFVGVYCDVPVDACDNHQCQNGGACVLDDDTCLTYTCSCPLCYTGEFCQTKVDACDNHQCQNGAACEPKGELCTEYTCQCSGCFTGDLCDEVRDPCNPSPCLNNAQCNVLGDNCYSYTCECVGCFTGFNCEDPIPSPCDNNPCQNNGVCSVIAGVCSGYQCSCPDGFTGVNCEDTTIVNTNPCNNFPCSNGGTCTTIDSDSYNCLCVPGYTGINCQTPSANSPGQDSCNSSPCQNGASCVNSYDSSTGTVFYLPQYTCICETGFTGPNCGSNTATSPSLDVCSSGVEPPCQNGGTCTNMYQSFSQGMDFYCDCPIGWTGHTCETPSINPCASGPCENGGICMPFNTYFQCDCPEGFFGTTCEVAQGDTERPTISNCPEDITRTISSSSGISVTWVEPTATDAGTTQRLLRSHTPGSFFPLGDTAVNYVFTDNSANLATCTFYITVTLAETDNVPPVIQNCPSTSVAQAPAGSTSAEVSWIVPSATDNSGIAVTVSNNYNPGDAFPVGETVVAYTFTDDAGNQNTCTFSVRVVVEVVNQSPTITFCPSGTLTYSTLGADSVVVNFPAPTAVDDSGFTPSVNSNFVPGQSFDVGSYTVTYTFTDNIGLTSDCTFNILVVSGGDVRPPTISDCPNGAITALAGTGASGASVSWTAPTATDVSGPVTSTSNYSPGAFFPVGTTTVTYTFTDQVGNEARCVFNVIVTGTNVNETPAPTNLALAPTTNTITATWTPPNGAFNSYQLTISGGSIVNTQTLPQSSSSYTATGLEPATAYVVTLVANGNAGASNSISETATTNPEQGQPPSSPSNVNLAPSQTSITVSFDAASGDVTGYNVGLGTTSNADDVTTTLAPGSTSYTFGSLSPSTQYFVSVQAFNGFGSSPSVVQSATTSDVVIPDTDIFITNCPVSIAASLPFGSYAFVDWEDPVATSPLGAVDQTGGPLSSSGYFQTGTYPIVYEFQDVNGNSATCSFNVYVTDGSDNTPPEVTFCPSNVVVQAASGQSSAVVTWNVPTATDASEPITAVSNYSPGDSFDVGTYLVVYNLIDNAGLYSTCSFEVTVTASGVITDMEDPELTNCPTDIVSIANLGSSSMVVSWIAPDATDNSGSVTVTVSTPSGSTFPIGTTTVTYTATDATGNTDSCSFDITVLSAEDNTPPTLSNCPSDMTVFAAQNAQGAVAGWSSPSATDNSGENVAITSDFASGTLFPIGATLVTITATDSSGNIDTCSFTVTVIGATDNVGPVTSNCPASRTITAAIGSTSAVATWTDPTFTDSSGVRSVTSNFNSGSSFPIGTTIVTYTATDTLGNTGVCSFSINVIAGTDSTRPTFINCPSAIEASVPFGSTGTTVTWTEPIALDNSGSATVVASQTSGTFFSVGATTVVYTATDPSGNFETCSFVVTVSEPVDVTPPELQNCPTGISATVNPGSSFAVVTWTPPTATDNLGTPVVLSNFPSGSSFPIGTTTVTYTAVDGNGNDASCSFDVVVTNGATNAAPVVTFCPNNGAVYFTAPEGSSINVDFAPPTATDDSGSVTTTSTNEPGDEFALGQHTVTYTFSDAQGLTASCTFSFEVQVGGNPCSSNPCSPSEQCFYIPSQYLCINNGRRRREAEMLDLSDVCPCENGGICLLDDATSSATCECPVGYTGVLCEIDTLPAANVNVHNTNRYHDGEIQEWSSGNSALLWTVIICMAIMLVVIISLSALLCYVVPRLVTIRQHRSKIDEIPIMQ